MGRNHSKHYHRLRGWIQTRIQELSQSIDSRFGAYRKVILGVLVSLATLLTAYFAHRESQAEALRQWNRNHFPSQRTFSCAMFGNGMSELQDLKEAHRMQRTLPLGMDSPGSVWIDSLSNWVAYFSKKSYRPAQKSESPLDHPTDTSRVDDDTSLGFLEIGSELESEDDSLQTFLYCLDCKQKPGSWDTLGIGWEALEKAEEAVYQEKMRRDFLPKSQSVQVRTEYDPRELRY
jgi:hypothetical protein